MTQGQTLVDTLVYDAFGVSEADTNPQATPLKFVGSKGYQLDADSNFELLGHRYYSTATGRFISQDPVKDGDNWYSYVENNPLGKVDPSGEIPMQPKPENDSLLGQLEDALDKFLDNLQQQAQDNIDPANHDPGTLPNGKTPEQEWNAENAADKAAAKGDKITPTTHSELRAKSVYRKVQFAILLSIKPVSAMQINASCDLMHCS